MGFQPPFTTNPPYSAAQQQTMPLPGATPLPIPPPGPFNAPALPPPRRTKRIKRTIAIIVAFALVIVMYFIWNNALPTSTASSSNPTITQQNVGNSATSGKNSTPNATSSNGDIQAYIVGAVKHPGVYTLPSGARVYLLVQAAGGPLPKANLVALNLAAPLTDGEEVYVTVIGEVPPTYMGGVPGPGNGASGTPTSSGQLVNINTASVDELRQNLHVSSTTAQNIVNYRLQHGPYTSVDQLLQVVSRSIYDKIKGLVTV